MYHHLSSFVIGIGCCILFTSACTPTERNYGSGGSGGAGGSGGDVSTSGISSSSSSGGSAGAGGASCVADTADCNQDGICETNLLGDDAHCGACDNPCMAPMGGTSKCVAGNCEYTCDTGTQDCDQNPATACQDVLADAANCGACGHDCLGGMCSQGQCQPVLAFDTQFTPNNTVVSLAVFGPDLYWGTIQGDVAKVSLDGTMYFMLGNANGAVFSLAATINGVYATNGNRVSAFKPTGGLWWDSVGDPGVNSVAANDLNVVWTSTNSGRVRRAESNGNNQKLITSSEQGPTSIVLEGGIARWSNSNTGEIRESSVFGLDNAIAIFATPPDARFLVQDGPIFFWLSNNLVRRGGAVPGVEDLFPTGPDVRAFVADQNHLYWTVGSAGEVWRASRTSPYNPTPVATGQAEPHALVVGPNAIYWANRGDGKIMRLAR